MEKNSFPVDIRGGLRQNSVCVATEERTIMAVFTFLTFALSRFVLCVPVLLCYSTLTGVQIVTDDDDGVRRDLIKFDFRQRHQCFVLKTQNIASESRPVVLGTENKQCA